MGQRKTPRTIILEAKTPKGEEKIGYHGAKWLFLGFEVPRLLRSFGECYVCRSRDGSKILHVRREGDPDISCRLV